jgi:plasminogen activator inhibitor 1 RNA-binding protein
MDDFYSVSTVNRFSLFGGVEDDPGDAPFSPTNASGQDTNIDLKKDKQSKNKPRDKQQTTKTTSKQSENISKKAEEGTRQNRQGKTGERTSSTSGYSSNRGKPQRRFQDRGRQGSEEPEEGEGRPSTTTRGRGTRRGGTRGGMGRNGAVGRGGKREFDRRSGSDKSSVKPFEKREGGGAHNWGNVRDDLKASTSDQTEWPSEEAGETKEGETVK